MTGSGLSFCLAFGKEEDRQKERPDPLPRAPYPPRQKVRSQAILAWRRRGWNSQGWKP